MDAQLKAKWVAALRSGEYQQGTISLHNSVSNTYCCLGVLAVVAGWPLSTPTDADAAYKTFPLLTGEIYTLERMNDTERKTFPEIADHIEANIPVSA